MTARTLTLAEQADERLLYAVDNASLVTEEVVAAFGAAADRGVRTVLATLAEAWLNEPFE